MARKAAQGNQTTSPNDRSQDASTRTKFTLYNFAGQEKAFYLVDKKNLENS